MKHTYLCWYRFEKRNRKYFFCSMLLAYGQYSLITVGRCWQMATVSIPWHHHLRERYKAFGCCCDSLCWHTLKNSTSLTKLRQEIWGMENFFSRMNFNFVGTIDIPCSYFLLNQITTEVKRNRKQNFFFLAWKFSQNPG